MVCILSIHTGPGWLWVLTTTSMSQCGQIISSCPPNVSLWAQLGHMDVTLPNPQTISLSSTKSQFQSQQTLLLYPLFRPPGKLSGRVILVRPSEKHTCSDQNTQGICVCQDSGGLLENLCTSWHSHSLSDQIPVLIWLMLSTGESNSSTSVNVTFSYLLIRLIHSYLILFLPSSCHFDPLKRQILYNVWT